MDGLGGCSYAPSRLQAESMHPMRFFDDLGISTQTTPSTFGFNTESDSASHSDSTLPSPLMSPPRILSPSQIGLVTRDIKPIQPIRPIVGKTLIEDGKVGEEGEKHSKGIDICTDKEEDSPFSKSFKPFDEDYPLKSWM